jgi:hypothetical protein
VIATCSAPYGRGGFQTIEQARDFCRAFFDYYYYNHHRHSGIALMTPTAVHDGHATQFGGSLQNQPPRSQPQQRQ